MKHLTDPLSAKEIRDALGVTDEDLEAARRAIGGTMSEVGRLLLISGIVGDYDGAYDWVDTKDYDKPEYSVGYHESSWPGESYTVIEVYDSATIASLQAEVRQAVFELVKEDKWEKPMMRLCKIAGIEYPAITTDVTPQSVADALSKDGKL